MATKSPKSPGSQFTAKGVIQGNALVSPVDGLPVNVIIDGAGVHRLAVDADLTADNITVDTRDLTPETDTVQIGDSNTGAHVKVNVDGSIDVNVALSAATDNIGISDQISGNKLIVNSDGSINADITGSATVSGTVNTNLNGLNSFQTSQYSVGTSAVQLSPTPLTNRSSLSVKVITTSKSDIVYVGNSNSVTISTGYPLFNGDSLQLDLTAAHEIWVIGTSAGQTAALLEIGI